ncbi:MAG: glycosyl hydrolase [Acidobacteriota bacterium]
MRRALLLIAVVFTLAASPVGGAVKIDSNTFGAIEARDIGPATMGGRIMAIDAVNGDPRIIYVGSASGGVWKSISGGTTFQPVFDKYTQSIGAVTIDQAHPDTVWVGTGETCTRNSVSVGAGVYRTTDAGDNWTLVGLEATERISRIIVDPTDSKIVYVAATGHLWDSNEERGVYKTTDAGKTWQRVLFVDKETGCADLAMDPQEHNTLYAAMWQFRRKPYFFTSGGPGSGIYRTKDGGKTWAKVTKGLPEGDLGRIALAVAPSRPSVVYANVEARKSGLYRSDDMGESWTLMNASFNVISRPFYFSHLIVDPKDYRRVYKPGFSLSVSSDGGQSFSGIFSGFGGNVHSDHHALWINPNNTLHMLLGTDGGVYVSYDKGNTWNFLNNLPVSQFYHVAFDMEQPYNVYGGLQDNGSWMGPSASPNGIENKDWKNVGFGDGFWVLPDPADKDIIYCEYQGGNLLRFHKSVHETKEIRPYPKEGEPKFRFNWNTPIAISPKSPSALYVGAQYMFRSTDKGESWVRISGDLTTNDPAKQKQEDSGGLTIDNSTAENHCTIYTIGLSPLDEKEIWAGTDDGNLQLTRDAGKTWTNVVANIPGLPKCTWCSWVEPSRFNAGTAYVTFDGHQTGDMKPHAFKTTDFGSTWKSITTDALKGWAHVIREDLVKPDLLFVGTELGLFVTVDGGEQWAQFTGKLPNVPVCDIAIHPRESDLILATHGRGIMIVDDITPLRQITPAVLDSNVHVFESRPSKIVLPKFEQDFAGDSEYVGSNPGDVARITYYLKDRHVFGDMKLDIYDPGGKLMKTLPGGKRRGINRVTWYMRMKPPKVPPAPVLAGGAMFGPMVPEGTYTVKLVKGNESYTGSIKVIMDPASPHSAEDRALQQKTVRKLYDMQDQLGYVADCVTSARDQARERAKKLGKGTGLAKELDAFADRLDKLHKTLVATREGGFLSGEEQLRERVVDLYQAVAGYGGRPTQSQLDRMVVLENELRKAEQSYKAIADGDLNALNAKLKGKSLDPISILTKEEWDKKEST